MSMFVKLREYDRQCGKYFDIFVNIDEIVAVSPDSNTIYTTAITGGGDGVFTISKGSMCELIQVLREREKQ